MVRNTGDWLQNKILSSFGIMTRLPKTCLWKNTFNYIWENQNLSSVRSIQGIRGRGINVSEELEFNKLFQTRSKYDFQQKNDFS